VIYTTDGTSLASFNAATPANNSIKTITGLTSGSQILGIDVNPNGGALVGLGSDGTTYVIDANSGAATATGKDASSALTTSEGVDIDFNPTVQNIYRVVSTTGDNYRINAATGARPGTDTKYAYRTGDVNAGKSVVVSAVAYTNSGLNGGTVPTSTVAYVIDTQNQVLARLGGSPAGDTATGGSPNTGALTTIGSLNAGITVGGFVGFDILGANTGYVMFKRQNEGGYYLHTIDLTTGQVTKSRLLTPDEAPVRGFAVRQN
jgi:WD40 repeat protein